MLRSPGLIPPLLLVTWVSLLYFLTTKYKWESMQQINKGLLSLVLCLTYSQSWQNPALTSRAMPMFPYCCRLYHRSAVLSRPNHYIGHDRLPSIQHLKQQNFWFSTFPVTLVSWKILCQTKAHNSHLKYGGPLLRQYKYLLI